MNRHILGAQRVTAYGIPVLVGARPAQATQPKGRSIHSGCLTVRSDSSSYIT